MNRSNRTVFMALLLSSALLAGCASNGPQEFDTPDAAAAALADGVRTGDKAKLLAIMGSDAKPIVSSGDEFADRQRGERFLALYNEKHSLVPDAFDRQTLVVGNDNWPLPIPIVQRGGKWVFDVKAGKEEILNRRIGENELSAIEVCKAIGDAQQEYALRDPDGDGVHAYARKFPSDPGKRNGLFWPTADGEEPSPLGEMVAAARAEGYKRRATGRTPYHGYYYKILESQGPAAPGGALDYVVNDKMTLGFGVVAWPAEYGTSGVMTFIMGSDGVVYQQDLGDDTAKRAEGMRAFDPGEGWTKAG